MGIRVTTPAPVKVTVKSGYNQVVHSSTSFVGALGDPGAVQRTGDTMTGPLVLLANTTTSNVVPITDQTYDLGSPDFVYKTVYADTIYGSPVLVDGGYF